MIENHPLCPEKHPLVVRNSKYGKFFGCLTYPEHQIVVERPNCPNGHIMKLRSGRFGEFFGCVEYPKCNKTYNFEVKDSSYHARLWYEYEHSELFEMKESKSHSKNYMPKLEKTKKIKFSKNEWKIDLSRHIEKNQFSITAYKDKNHPEVDQRIPKNLTDEQRLEYIRLYESDYTNHILLKIPTHLLNDYLQKSIDNRRFLS